jgi:hypothetical protein
MKSFFRLELFFVLAVSANLSPLKGAVVNDGTSTNTLIKIFNGNENDDGAVTSLLVDTNGFLIAEQAATTTFPARRNIWYPLGGFATSGVYTVSADFQPAQYSNERQGGVMGWLNLSTHKGISFRIRPGDPSPAFLVSVVDFAATDPNAVENATNLFNLNGTAATEDYGSAWSDLGTNYVFTNFATFQLAFTAPSAADVTALSNAMAHVTAKVFQGTNTSGVPIQTGRTIELLTDLPLPGANDHRFGYVALWSALFQDGSTIGYLDNLTAEGQVTVLTNLPPSVTITNPTSGATFAEPATVTIQADATDLDGTISRVDFFAGASLIGTATNSPFNFTWNNVAAGSYALTAQAMDNRGATATSRPVIITVTTSGGTGPTMTIVQTGTTIEISWPSAGYQLQTSTNLAPGSWTDVPNTLSTNHVVVTITSGTAFFRLMQGSTSTPQLSIQYSSGTVTVSWPQQVTGYRLQWKTDLNVAVWTDLSAPNNQFSESATGPSKFYRLISP